MNILKIPLSKGSIGKNNGCEKGPDFIVKHLLNLCLNERFLDTDFKVDTLNVDNKEYEENYEKILSKDCDVYLGGDHSLTYYTFKKFSKEFNNPGIIIFDAHPDCLNTDFKTITHEDFLFNLINEGILKKENLILLGLRSIDKIELDFLKKNKIRFFTAKDLFDNKEEICDSIMEQARDWDGLYLSLDIDVLDPAFAPGTGYLEPGGLSTRELLYFLHRIKLLKNFNKFDIVEVNPDRDINEMTSRAAAKILKELI